MSERQLIVAPSYPVSDLERMAKAFAASKLFGIQNAEQGLALCLLAQAEGLHPATAARDYHIINGKPAKKAEAMLRDFITAGGKVEWHTLTDDAADATFSHPAGGAARIEWTLTRAKQAGIAGNSMWAKYPRQMLRARVVSEGVRTVCPSATSGMYVEEEVRDMESEREAKSEPITVTVVSDYNPDNPPPSAASTSRANPNSRASLKRSNIYETLRDEMDACKTLDELDAWNKRREADIKALPNDWYDALGDRFQICREELTAPVPEAVEAADAELDEAFRQTVGGRRSAPVAGDNRDVADAA